MDIKRNGAQPSQKAPAEHFSGTVRIAPLFQSSAPGRAGGAYVTFEPCARSDWHTHPLGRRAWSPSGPVFISAGAARSKRDGPATS